MDDLITVLELLREKHRFTGYVHVKMVPGAEPAQIERLTQLASRVSLNLEAPCGQHLVKIAPEKSLGTALAGLDLARAGGAAAAPGDPRRAAAATCCAPAAPAG